MGKPAQNGLLSQGLSSFQSGYSEDDCSGGQIVVDGGSGTGDDAISDSDVITNTSLSPEDDTVAHDG